MRGQSQILMVQMTAVALIFRQIHGTIPLVNKRKCRHKVVAHSLLMHGIQVIPFGQCVDRNSFLIPMLDVSRASGDGIRVRRTIQLVLYVEAGL